MYAIVAYEGLFFAFDAILAVPAQLRFPSTGNWYLISASICSCPSPFPTGANTIIRARILSACSASYACRLVSNSRASCHLTLE